jgi:DNA-binding NarL/FixJ family response regulator
MDVTLQGSVDGIELARRIRAQYAGIRVVYLTGQADPATRQRAAATAPAAYILKPFSGREIVEAIDRILAGPDRDG